MFYVYNPKETENRDDYMFKAIRSFDKSTKGEEICKTYPEYVIIPNSVTQAELEGSSQFRTKNRFPGMSYYYKKNGASLWRSSQNKEGLSNRSKHDETMLYKIGACNPNGTNRLAIYDARSKLSATANKVKKGGYENVDKFYTNCTLTF